MIWAFDLDGVLAKNPPASDKTWGRMSGPERRAHKAMLLSWYSVAPKIFDPNPAEFHVITARKDDPAVRKVTEAWLIRHFGARVLSLHMLAESRSIENVVRFKGKALTTLGVSDFVEDNEKILKGLRIAGARARLHLFRP